MAPVINRDEAVATMFAIADLNAKVERIIRILDEDTNGEGPSEDDS